MASRAHLLAGLRTGGPRASSPSDNSSRSNSPPSIGNGATLKASAAPFTPGSRTPSSNHGHALDNVHEIESQFAGLRMQQVVNGGSPPNAGRQSPHSLAVMYGASNGQPNAADTSLGYEQSVFDIEALIRQKQAQIMQNQLNQQRQNQLEFLRQQLAEQQQRLILAQMQAELELQQQQQHQQHQQQQQRQRKAQQMFAQLSQQQPQQMHNAPRTASRARTFSAQQNGNGIQASRQPRGPPTEFHSVNFASRISSRTRKEAMSKLCASPRAASFNFNGARTSTIAA